MLSRVAERLYWMARYIERSENTARMVMAFSHLALDMPRHVGLSWRRMLTITGSDALFDERYNKDDERSCVRFLLADQEHSGSIINTLALARENVRTTRDLVPAQGWESVNELYLFAKENLDSGLSKRGRYAYLNEVVGRCQQITGLLAGTMSHDHAYDFVRTGRNLERADMTSRILDVGAIGLLTHTSNTPKPFEGLLWINILKSLSAFQMYRQHVRRRVSGAEVVHYLLQNLHFPRAVAHALTEVETALSNLPRNEVPLRFSLQVKRHVLGAEISELMDAETLHRFIDELQKEMAEIHGYIADTWFKLERAD
ncbi:alpha-E domain-containing protein [Thiorhodospira sibirica]|uniref:alpha-E domain-containing protein n=1 Tax=Thiorhodospira sibirica TaxID=154347 RepID=UPI00022C33E9|nr:alpha-E domain-containing protein [Thiorhodospira sibirica]